MAFGLAAISGGTLCDSPAIVATWHAQAIYESIGAPTDSVAKQKNSPRSISEIYGAGGPISVVQFKSSEGSSGSTTVTFVQVLAGSNGGPASTSNFGNWGATVTASNRLIFGATWGDTVNTSTAASITGQAGEMWTQIGTTLVATRTDLGFGYTAFFECRNPSAVTNSPTLNTVSTAQHIGGTIVEYSGSASSSPSYGYATATGNSAGPAQVSMAVSHVGDALVAMGPNPDSLDQGAAVSGCTNRGGANWGGQFVELVPSDTSAHNIGSTIGSSEHWSEAAMAIPSPGLAPATFSSSVAIGDMIVVILAAQDTSAVTITAPTDNSGTNTYAAGASVSFHNTTTGVFTALQVFYAINGAAGAWAVSNPSTGGHLGTYIFEVANVSLYDTGAGATNTSTTSTPADTGSWTTSFLNEIVLAATISNVAGSSAGSGYTLLAVTGTLSSVLEYALVGAGTQDTTANLTSAGDWGILGAAFYAPNPPSLGDSVARQFVGARAIGESVTAPTDAVSMIHGGGGGTNYTGAISESVTAPTDAVVRVFVGARSIADSVTAPTDAVARAGVFARTIAESVGAPTDAVSRVVAYLRAISESVGAPTDAVLRQFIGARALAESIGAPSDSLTRAFVGARSLSESITVPSDAIARAFVGARTIAESIGVPSDAIARAVVNARALAESVTPPSDAVARAFEGARSIADSVTAPTDSVSRAYVGARSIADSITAPSDSVSGIVGGGGSNPRSIGESITAPTDAVARVFVGLRAISESVTGPSDAVTRALAASRAISESVVAPSDAVVRIFVGSRAIAESVSAPTDAVARVAAHSRSVAESITAPTDALARSLALVAGIAESIAAPSDAVSRKDVGARGIAESVAAPSDSVGRAVAYSRSISESIGTPTDAIARSFGILGTITESIAAPSDAVSHVGVYARAIVEFIPSPSDAVAVLLHSKAVPIILDGSVVFYGVLIVGTSPVLAVLEATQPSRPETTSTTSPLGQAVTELTAPTQSFTTQASRVI